MAEKKFNTTLAENRKARHDYTVLETIECGMVLSGTEVKSIRHGEVSLSGAYAAVLHGELWL
ncbi:MAG: SsrA-binding protein, partial [Kiritimatiellae bacterium]|nr:SsrA-binding protein [Kiritimatiellia bacterium]